MFFRVSLRSTLQNTAYFLKPILSRNLVQKLGGVKLCEQLRAHAPGVKLWAAMYGLHLQDKKQDEIMKQVDGLMLWTWNPEKLRELDQYVARMEKAAPDKLITFGLYMI